MNEIHTEQLSALLDDELEPTQAQFLLRRIAADEGLARRFEQYTLIGEAIRGMPVALGLAARVRHAVSAGEARGGPPAAPATAPGDGPSTEAAPPARPHRDAGPGASGYASANGRIASAGAPAANRWWRPVATAAAAGVVAVSVVTLLPPGPDRASVPIAERTRQDGQGAASASQRFPTVPATDAEPLPLGQPARATFARYLIQHQGVTPSSVRPTFVANQAVYPDIAPRQAAPEDRQDRADGEAGAEAARGGEVAP